ncbi:darobactin export ABC transporter periplasmic adaptor subunit [Yersinia kristensenii]|uniref:darobactin export ABC transporter periplasmic adaptor subunit n=1 Tax=Yersinia kristensenii TaxID=28152 RepID=UPI0005E40E8B|nr:darobactin export ABC transporter periplasmic adaptor subunit [Yersinia kristensenii]MDA5522918.1 darobactin export ABC transporter periplasmic adaptor subunit [Yersinia kristensenii]MDX6736215.1 darobactin export ABC transporter periplasmic adaptor subunit [Yersinia kristensenii]PHZ35010.1 RND transporter [Yersinia kristensenii]QKJ17105.1 darobactin export ABC transporter periplasmic adaptor subunit [Yersinia kristensenii]CNK76781.1 RND family efflux transporter MFP subunit [Yersinia krist
MDINIEQRKNKNTTAKLIIFSVLLAVITCLYYIYYLSTAQRSLLISRENAVFHTIESEVYQDVLTTRAIAVPKESMIISSERGGKVTEVAKQAFDAVEKGDVIIRLSNYDFMLETTSRIVNITEQISNLRNMKIQLEQDNRETKLNLQEAQHQITTMSRDLARHQVLDMKSMIAKSELENQVSMLKNWQIKSEILKDHDNKNKESFPLQFKRIDDSILLLERMMDIIENGMEQLVITAPIDGVLSILDVELGQQIKPGEKIAIIDNLKSYYFNVYFSEYYLDKIKPQSQILAKINGQDTQLLIESVSTIVENGKFKAKLIPLHDTTSLLKRGQSIEIQIPLQEKNNSALMIPTDSVISDDDGNNFIYIYQPENDLAIKSKIEIDRRSPMKTEIIAGIKVGEIIVTPPETNNSEYDIIEFK